MEPITPLLPCTKLLLHALEVDKGEHRLILKLSSTQPNPPCPCCGQEGSRVHSYYARTIADLPLADFAVRLRLTVRKLRCDSPHCHRKVFCERLPTVVRPWGRQTNRLRERQRHVGMALGGQAGARLCEHLGAATSRNTLLRNIRTTPVPSQSSPRVLGVDDWAKAKGQDYGTILVDMEAGRIIELLADREAQTLADWLRRHPGVETICRDRASSYAEGARSGAPAATQIADRFHLIHNLVDVLQQVFERHRSLLTLRVAQPEDTSMPALARTQVESFSQAEQVLPAPVVTLTEKAQARQVHYQKARALHAEGWTKHAIARHLGIRRHTVRHYIEADSFPDRRHGRSKLNPYKAYLIERWNAGCRTGKQLLAEIQAQGYRGGRSIAYAYVTSLRKAQGLPPRSRMPGPELAVRDEQTCRVTPRQAAFLALRREEKRREGDEEMLAYLERAHAEFAEALDLGRAFAHLLRQRKASEFDEWLERASRSTLQAFRRFAKSLRRDYAAVKAALEERWSSGAVEGHVNRLKLLKRQMYGRAKLDLLQQRLLYYA